MKWVREKLDNEEGELAQVVTVRRGRGKARGKPRERERERERG